VTAQGRRSWFRRRRSVRPVRHTCGSSPRPSSACTRSTSGRQPWVLDASLRRGSVPRRPHDSRRRPRPPGPRRHADGFPGARRALFRPRRLLGADARAIRRGGGGELPSRGQCQPRGSDRVTAHGIAGARRPCPQAEAGGFDRRGGRGQASSRTGRRSVLSRSGPDVDARVSDHDVVRRWVAETATKGSRSAR
jgi:hypothetical protein